MDWTVHWGSWPRILVRSHGTWIMENHRNGLGRRENHMWDFAFFLASIILFYVQTAAETGIWFHETRSLCIEAARGGASASTRPVSGH